MVVILESNLQTSIGIPYQSQIYWIRLHPDEWLSSYEDLIAHGASGRFYSPGLGQTGLLPSSNLQLFCLIGTSIQVLCINSPEGSELSPSRQRCPL